MEAKQLYQSITSTIALSNAPKKGRSSQLVARRNRCLLARYYYYCHVQSLPFSECMNRLQSDFFLSIRHINAIVLQNVAELKKMKENKHTYRQIKRDFPQYKW